MRWSDHPLGHKVLTRVTGSVVSLHFSGFAMMQLVRNFAPEGPYGIHPSAAHRVRIPGVPNSPLHNPVCLSCVGTH